MLLGWVLGETARVHSEAGVSLLFQTTKAFLPTMLEINHGHIVTVASSLGLFSTAGVEVCQMEALPSLNCILWWRVPPNPKKSTCCPPLGAQGWLA